MGGGGVSHFKRTAPQNKVEFVRSLPLPPRPRDPPFYRFCVPYRLRMPPAGFNYSNILPTDCIRS